MVKQFDIYWINLNPTVGSEVNKKRPCIIISPDEMNQALNTVIIAPLTSTIKNYPTRVKIKVKDRTGEVMLDQIRSIDISRLGNKHGTISNKDKENIKETLIRMFK